MADKAKIVNKFRYYCIGCTARVLYAPTPFQFHHAVCPNCGKVIDDSNYSDQDWLPMSEEEILEQE